MRISTDTVLSAPRTVARTLGFTEGPVWTPSGRLFVTSVNRGILYEVFLDDRAPRAVAETGGGPNGMTLGTDGALWVTQNGGSAMPSRSLLEAQPCLQRVRPAARSVETVSSPIALDAPSDCVADQNGRIWFTDPDGHEFGSDARPGRVLRYDPATGVLESLTDDVYFPNGIALGPHGGLYVAETARDRVTLFDVTEQGLRRDTSFRLAVESPDGLAFDAGGGLWVAGSRSGRVSYFGIDGTLKTTLDIGSGSMPTSVCFAGPEMRTLIITVAKGGRVLALDVDVPGLRVPSPMPSQPDSPTSD